MLILLRRYSFPIYTQLFSHKYFSKSKNLHKLKRPNYPPLDELTLKETFIKGDGPGGQKVNKSENCVHLVHTPTGVSVTCHESRDLHVNRRLARRRLQESLDFHFNKENSQLNQLKREASKRKASKKKETNRKLELKKQFKDRHGL